MASLSDYGKNPDRIFDWKDVVKGMGPLTYAEIRREGLKIENGCVKIRIGPKLQKNQKIIVIFKK